MLIVVHGVTKAVHRSGKAVVECEHRVGPLQRFLRNQVRKLFELADVHATNAVTASNESRWTSLVCIESLLFMSGRYGVTDLASKELANALLEIINRIERVSPTDESDMPAMRGELELEHRVSCGNLADFLKNLSG